MSLRSLNNRLVLAGLLAAAVATAAIFAFVLRSDDEAEKSRGEKAAPSGPPLETWSTEDATQLTVHVDDEAGPIVEFDDQTSVVLTPVDAQLAWSKWRLQRVGKKLHIIGDGTFGEASARAVWTLVEGNPQAHLRVTLAGIPAPRLAEAITLASSFPAGEVTVDAPVAALPPGLARPARWSSGNHGLRFTNFNGDSIAPGDGEESASLTFHLWRPQRDRDQSAWAACAEAKKVPSVDLDAELTVTVGPSAPIARWSLAKGHSSALVPIFDAPEHHPDAQLAQSAARDADRWLLRVRTLVYGHSSPEDPRYGNGGLLGHGLGGTVVVPKRFAQDKRVRRLAEGLEGTQAELAPRAGMAEGYETSSRFAPKASCETLVELAAARVPAVVTGTTLGTKARALDVDSGPGGLPATVAPVQLNGSLATLLGEGFAPETLEPMTQRFDIYGFSTPFVATRNPLIGAFKEALLEPERDGHWTVSADVASALADLALWKEAQPLLVTSLGDLASHLGDMRGLAWWWAEDGSLVVFNPHEHVVHGATLAVPGTATVTLGEKQPLRSRVPSFPDARAVTLFWLDVKPGRHTIKVERKGVELIRPEPVEWTLVYTP